MDLKKVSTPTGIDALPELCRDAGIEIGDRDGLLLVTVSPEGLVKPTVLRIGLLTEGRIEQAMMPIFTEIVRARGRAAQKARQEQASAHNTREVINAGH